MKFGFLGSGNMASAIVKGMVNSGYAEPKNILIHDISDAAADSLCVMTGVFKVKSAEELIVGSDILFIAVKPQICHEILPELKEVIKKHMPVIVSMAAGVSIGKLESHLGFKPPIVRMMPNINATINESVTAVCSNSKVSEHDFKIVTDALTVIGQTIPVEERYFGIFTAMASNSPAFTYMFIDSLARGAQKLGMNKKLAVEIAARAVMGSAKMLIETGQHPHELMDKVASPGGSTIEGICVLSEAGFDSAVVKAVEACVNKDKSLN